MKEISIDLETFSSVSLKDCGVYRYAEAPDAELLLFGYSADGEPVRVIDVAQGEKIPEDILEALSDDKVTKWAFNASFERIFLSIWLKRNYPEHFRSYSISEDTVGNYLDPSSWRCTMTWAAFMGLPLSLEKVSSVLKLTEQKMSEGKNLIRYFCVPRKPTKNNPALRNYPSDSPERWQTFKEYNRRDVAVEMGIQKKLARFPVPEAVWEEYHLSEEINDRGILLDKTMVENAIAIDAKVRSDLMEKMRTLTALENPNSNQQLQGWLKEKGIETDSLDKNAISELIPAVSDDVKEVLRLKQQISRSSVRKYKKMMDTMCEDNRARGMFQFYGASRTGRWASRHIQMQNLRQNHLPDLAEARAIVRSGDYETLSMFYEDIPDTLSQLIRTAFIPRKGYMFYVSDFSAIEARVLAHIAGEKWRSEVFRRGGDIYCASAQAMFHVPVEKHGRNAHLRQKGKVAELACIAEGELVLTDHGLIPIENISLHDRVWDGKEFVQHEGVIYKGIREVISYEGLTATPDHLVFIEGKPEPVQFGIAASTGSSLLKSGYDISSGLLDSDNIRTARVYDIINAGRYHRFTVSGKLVHNCGYGGSVGAMKAMGGLEMGLTEDELKGIVVNWRASNPNIVALWWAVDKAAKECIRKGVTTSTHGIRFSYERGFMFITLPSGRRLAYVKPRIGENRFGGESITYMGTDAQKNWSRIESYGPKIVENITQAISRDILAYAMRTLAHCFICGHVHDELIIECREDVSLDAICEQMARTPPWIEGLNLAADGYSCEFYQKS